MTMTRAQLVALTRDVSEADSTTRWPPSVLLATLGMVHWREWRGLLGANPALRVATRVVTTDASNAIDVATLAAGTGDTLETLHKVIAVATDADGVLSERTLLDRPFGTTLAGAARRREWVRVGSVLQLHAGDAGQTVRVVVNHLPARADLLSGDTVAVVFPDGYELLLAYEAGAALLDKGDDESGAGDGLRRAAERIRGQMLADAARQSARPLAVRAPDDVSDWG